MKILYRISEKGNLKNKPTYVNPKNIFLHFLKVFSNHEIYVVADNVSDDFYQFLCSNIHKERIMRTQLSNSGAFLYAVNYAITHFHDSENVYFAEDDYVYTKKAPRVIEEGLTIADYSSGYDHPDKYMNHSEGGPNPYISGGGELTRVLLTSSSHWKFTNSCCMTFATTVKTLKNDVDVYKKYCGQNIPNDFRMFVELIEGRKRKLVSSIPAVSTHGETAWLAKFVDWENEAKS
jgi:hypothetical protein